LFDENNTGTKKNWAEAVMGVNPKTSIDTASRVEVGKVGSGTRAQARARSRVREASLRLVIIRRFFDRERDRMERGAWWAGRRLWVWMPFVPPKGRKEASQLSH